MASTDAMSRFASKLVLRMTESAQGTLTFDKVETGLSVYDPVGWVIHKVQSHVQLAELSKLNSTGDYIAWALTSTNSLTTGTQIDSNPAVYMIREIGRLDFGTAASGEIVAAHFEDDYSTLPGGGLLVLPNPLYGSVFDSGASSAVTVNMVIWYSQITLSDKDYTNLIQARQLLISS